MIYIFRKEIKKWTPLLWIAFISIPLGYVAGYFVGGGGAKGEMKIAWVDKQPVLFKDYQLELSKVQSQIEEMRQNAQRFGISPELLLAQLKLSPEELAFQQVVQSILLNKVQRDLKLELDPAYFVEELGKSVPMAFLEPSGHINEKVFTRYLQRMNLTIPQYEDMKEEEFKRTAIEQCLESAVYIPSYIAEQSFDKKFSQKSFRVVSLPLEAFVARARKTPVTDKQLQTFYADTKEQYRAAEKRKATYWVIPAQVYLARVEVDDEAIMSSYEKNKNSLYRIPPEVKVRRILFKVASGAPQAQQKVIEKRAQGILAQIKANPSDFPKLARAHSEAKSAAREGLVDFFKRGTYSKKPKFEEAAFRLQAEGEVSGLVRSDEGFEIVQLVKRKAASAKPLSVVRAEIIEAIRARKAMQSMRSDLESLMYHMRTDSKKLATFVKEHNLRASTTDWVEDAPGRGGDLKTQITGKLFAKKDKESNYGYFPLDKDYVLYKEAQRQESRIPLLTSIKPRLEDDYYTTQARKSLKAFAKKAKREVIEAKSTLEKVGGEINEPVFRTGIIKSDATINSLKGAPGLVARAFDLTDPRQVLKYKDQDHYYLVQLENYGQVDPALFDREKKTLLDTEKDDQRRLSSGSFVASLLRTAKIEKNEELLKKSIM